MSFSDRPISRGGKVDGEGFGSFGNGIADDGDGNGFGCFTSIEGDGAAGGGVIAAREGGYVAGVVVDGDGLAAGLAEGEVSSAAIPFGDGGSVDGNGREGGDGNLLGIGLRTTVPCWGRVPSSMLSRVTPLGRGISSPVA